MLTGNDSLQVSIKISNTGDRAGKEVVQLYLRDDFASLDPDYERLIAFKKIELQAGASKQIKFWIGVKDLAFVSAQNQWITEEGAFTLRTGNRINVVKTTKFEYKK